MKYFYLKTFQIRFVLILNLILDKILSNYNNETAIAFSNETISYRTLIDEAFNVYSFLKSKNITSDWVAVSANEGWKSYAYIIGVWMNGKGYLPINVNAPNERNAEVLKSAHCNFILNKGSYINIGSCYDQSEFQDGNGLAYLLFTSGTTGKPKGVPISIQNLSSLTDHYQNHNVIQFSSSDVFLQSYELTFDVSVFCFTMAFMNRAQLVLPEQTHVKYQGLFKAINDYDVTVVSFVPSVIRMSFQFLDRLKLPSIKYSFFSGEALHGDWAEAWMKSVSNAKVYNCYGPTETVIVCTEEPLFELDHSYFKPGIPLPLGKPFSGVDLEITDGEICFTGDQVFNGYLNGERLMNYQSGDMAYFDMNNKLIFEGRKDDQIQWNGYRIQLSEIDSIITEKTGYWCKAIYHDGKLTLFTLCLVSEVNQELNNYFPIYYTPSSIVSLKEIPLNYNGKLDVAHLKAQV
jgi:acyl-coenzyme A synthetase/AMP-(fatty) acid ligase